MQDFHGFITVEKEQKQFLLRCIQEHRHIYPDCKKQTLKRKFKQGIFICKEVYDVSTLVFYLHSKHQVLQSIHTNSVKNFTSYVTWLKRGKLASKVKLLHENAPHYIVRIKWADITKIIPKITSKNNYKYWNFLTLLSVKIYYFLLVVSIVQNLQEILFIVQNKNEFKPAFSEAKSGLSFRKL